MHSKKLSKRGVWPLKIVAVLIVSIVGVVILLFWQQGVAEAAVNEKSAIEACISTNKARVFVEHSTSEYVATPRYCVTIDKTEGKRIVPTKKYAQTKEGSIEEIRNMMKNCWDMWLQGSEPNIFRLYPGGESCRICYRYRINDAIKPPPNMEEIIASLEEPFLAVPTTDNCDPPNGGWLENNLGACTAKGGTKVRDMEDGKICCRKDVRYECENKGGKCYKSNDARAAGFDTKYDKWNCPNKGQSCYIKDTGENYFSYISYILEYSELGGNIMIVDPNKTSITKGKVDVSKLSKIGYESDTIYAISFVSPAKTSIGVFQWLNPSYYVLILPAKDIGGPAKIWARHSQESIEASFGKGEDRPNSILFSSFDQAQEMGCKMV